MQNKVTFCKYRAPHPAFDKEWIRYIMRVSALILGIMAFSMQLLLAAPGYGQGNEQTRISLDFKNTPISKIFSAIEAKADVVIMYENTRMFKSEKVSISVKDRTVAEVLDELLKDRKLKWNIRENVIRVEAASPPISKTVSPSVSFNQPVLHAEPPTAQSITGRVTDSTGTPLVGASVKLKGANKGTNTNSKGEFTIDANIGDVLEISFVGFQNKEVSVEGNRLMVVLKSSDNKLDEVQIIAYGKTSQRFTTGDVTTVTSKDIEAQPVTNPLLALQGRVPGLVLTQTNGQPGAELNIRIQGQISLIQGSDPLVVIDGVPYPPMALFTMYQRKTALDYINPADIASITVLKDADATSIYGSRAAAGAILITTKHGTPGDTRVNLNYQQGFSEIAKRISMMNTQQYLEMRHQAIASDGLSGPRSTDYDVNGVWDTTRYTDWQKVFGGGSAIFRNAQISFSGGNANTQFRISGNYYKQGLTSPGNFGMEQGSAALNLVNTSLNKKLKSSVNMQFAANENKVPGTDLFSQMKLAPDAPALYQPDGSLNWARIPTGNGTDSVSTWTNPMAAYWYYKNQTNTKNFVGNATESYQLLQELEAKVNFGYNYQQGARTYLTMSGVLPPEYQYVASLVRDAQFLNGTVKTWQIEPQLNYQKHIFNGQLEALAGATFQETNALEQLLRGSGFSSDAAMYDIGAATSWRGSTTSAYTYRYQAFFGRLAYNWDNKYVFTGNLRRDGSTRFGTENRFHTFWSTAGAWIFSEENVVKRHFSFLSFGKLRLSYGTTGNDQIGNYQYQASYYYNTPIVPYQNAASLVSSGLPNSYLQWEETRKLSASIDLGFLKDRILLNANYYRNRSSNQLLYYPLPQITGFSSITANFPATIQNSGWTFTVNTINVKHSSIRWNSSLNITLARNKLIAFPGLETSSFANQYVIGQPITVKKVFRYAGVDPETGLYMVYKNDGTKTSTPNYSYQANSDQTKLMDLTPNFYGGLQNTVSYKNWNLNIFFQFSRLKNSIARLYDAPAGYGMVNGPVEPLTSYWKEPGDNVQYARFSATGNVPNFFNSLDAERNSDRDIVDASFIRLKNLSLSWTLPEKWWGNMKGKSLRLFAQGENLFTITSYPGLDPETGVWTAPPLRTVTFGIEASL